MTKRFITVLAVMSLLSTGTLSGLDFDFGGSIDNASTPAVTPGPGSAAFSIDQKDRVSVRGEVHFSPHLSVVAQGSYAFSLPVPLLVDLDFLRVDWRLTPSLRASFGRFVQSDFTGHVLNHTLDGAMVTLELPTGALSAGVGYSGLVLKPSSLIVMSRSDSADLSTASAYFASPRLVEMFDFHVPLVGIRQDVTLSVLFQQDLRPDTSVIAPGEQQQTVTGLSGGKLATQYAGIGLSGAIVGSLYYDSFFYLNTGQTISYVTDGASPTGFSYQYRSITAYLGGLGLRYYLESFLSSRAELRGMISSGDGDNVSYFEGNTAGASTLFIPISQEEQGLAFMPQLGNLIVLQADYSVKPFTGSRSVWENLQIMGMATTYLRPTTGPIYLGTNPASTDLYLGTELKVAANFRPFSDLGGALSLAAFLPNPGAFTGTAALPTFAGRFEVSFSF